ncbi:MAG TPA: DUF4397 domain-containing protein, partial [Saprospiraceae bacterium]|nr:DUF4397 domain-containing protein [Saprospiraceae bacterium]
VDVDEVLTGNLLSDLAYGEFTPYLALPPALYDVAVRATAATTPVGIYRADLSGLAGRALTVFASGLLGGSPGFGLFAALADGTVIELPTTPLARVQIIHNSPSPTVDVYAGALRLVDDFAFRTATPFVALPAARGFRVGVAPGTSSSVADTLLDFAVNFEAGKRYTVIANGVVGNPATPFTLAVDADAQEAAAAGFVAVSAFHGSPGAPAVDISERLAGPLVQGLAYGEFAPYLNLPPDAYYLDIRATGSPDIVDTYFADFSGLNGQALRVFASGMLGGAPAFGLFAALADGTVIELPSSPVARLQLLHNAPSASVDVYVSGQKMLDDFDFRTGTPFLFVPAGVALPLGIAPANSQSANDVIATFAPTLTNGGTYVAAVQGVAGGSPALSLVVNSAARERALDQDRVEVAVLHGIVDAPAVDVSNWFTDGLFVSDLAYGEFTDYLSLPPAFWALRASESGNLAKTAGIWAGDFSAGAGLAA